MEHKLWNGTARQQSRVIQGPNVIWVCVMIKLLESMKTKWKPPNGIARPPSQDTPVVSIA